MRALRAYYVECGAFFTPAALFCLTGGIVSLALGFLGGLAFFGVAGIANGIVALAAWVDPSLATRMT